jgi:hypothetical protein
LERGGGGGAEEEIRPTAFSGETIMCSAAFHMVADVEGGKVG